MIPQNFEVLAKLIRLPLEMLVGARLLVVVYCPKCSHAGFLVEEVF